VANKTKSLADLQSILSDQIDKVISGDSTPATANAVVNATSVILRSVKLQMDYYRQIGKTPEIPLLLADSKPQEVKKVA
jgi:hypothetical protein